MNKTNVIRILDKSKISYQQYDYSNTGAISGIEVAQVLNQNPERVFKTLLTVAKSKQHYVFLIPVAMELDLRKATECTGEKAIEMLKARELLPLTGYVHGGCSPIGMKSFFPTYIDESAEQFESIMFSAGKIGSQIEMRLEDLKKIIDFHLASLTKPNQT